MNFESLVIGAGFAGSVAARELAQQCGKSVLVLERRDHVGGSAYDCPDESGILIHRYGPHIFHTSDDRVWNYLSRYTEWYPYTHRVMASVYGKLLPVPFNLTSQDRLYGVKRSYEMTEKLVGAYGPGQRVSILQLRQSEDPDLAALANDVYELIFLHYTMKQWGKKPEEIDPSTTARVPVVISHDDRYFQDQYQGMPAEGYTAMFRRMLDHPKIQVQTGCDALERLRLENGKLYFDGEAFEGPVVYTGALDELFGNKLGCLPYRTLDFKFETLTQEQFQPVGTVNYTVDEDFTRITEFKHLTGQDCLGRTTILKEYPLAYTAAPGQTPYYPIANPESNALYAKYRALAEPYRQLHLLGRLAEYQYYNMDMIVGRALDMCDRIQGEWI